MESISNLLANIKREDINENSADFLENIERITIEMKAFINNCVLDNNVPLTYELSDDKKTVYFKHRKSRNDDTIKTYKANVIWLKTEMDMNIPAVFLKHKRATQTVCFSASTLQIVAAWSQPRSNEFGGPSVLL